MQTLSTLILAASIAWVGGQFWTTRRRLHSGEPVFPPVFAATLVFGLSIVLILAISASPLHLLWLFPFSFVLGVAMLVFPAGTTLIMACLGLLASLKPQQAAERPLRSDGERLTDGELLAKLRSFGIEIDRASLGRLCDETLSAEEITKPWLENHTFKTRREALESDWIWICVVVLWQRWFPDKPSFERLDDKIQAGYDRMETGDSMAACRHWLDAWTDVLHLLDKAGIRSIDEFDNRFRGTQSLFNWIQDLENELWNAGLEDREFLTARINVCEEGLRRFATENDLMTENWRRALAESYFELGETAKAEALYQEWLKTDPRWGWGWISWSDCYQFRFGRPELRDLNRSEQLLREGLSVAEVRDREDLAERLADLYEEQGRGEEAKEIRRQARGRLPQIQP